MDRTFSSVLSLLLLLLLMLSLEQQAAASGGIDLFCSPKLWEGKKWTLQITHTDQGPNVWESTSEIAVDVVGQRYASQETGTRHGNEYSIFYLYYYPQNTLYTVQDGQCRTSPVDGNVSESCLNWPDKDAVEGLKEYWGDYDTGTWCNGVRGIRDGVGYLQTMDPEGPVPLIEETQGVIHGVPTYTVSSYHNITLGIRDPAVFTPPDICIKRGFLEGGI